MWRLSNKSVVAKTSGSKVYGQFGLLVHYDKAKSEASCTLQRSFPVDGCDTNQVFALVLRPEQIAGFDFLPDAQGSKMDPQIFALMPDTLKSKIVWLTFRLLSTGTVQCPDAALPFAFTNPQERGFVAFSEICQTTSIDVYTGRGLVSQQQRAQLEAFALYLTRLRSDAVDLRRLRGGKGAQGVSWKDIQSRDTFDQTNPETKQDRVFT